MTIRAHTKFSRSFSVRARSQSFAHIQEAETGLVESIRRAAADNGVNFESDIMVGAVCSAGSVSVYASTSLSFDDEAGYAEFNRRVVADAKLYESGAGWPFPCPRASHGDANGDAGPSGAQASAPLSPGLPTVDDVHRRTAELLWGASDDCPLNTIAEIRRQLIDEFGMQLFLDAKESLQ